MTEKHDPTRNVPLWAKDKAREFIERQEVMTSRVEEEASLAALLMEVANKARSDEAGKWISDEVLRNENVILVASSRVLAEVRSVVEQTASDVTLACISDEERDTIKALRGALLARLEKL